MNSSATKFRKRIYGLPEQAARVCLVCPDFKYSIRKGELVGKGSMQPTPACCCYRFRLRYRIAENPKVWILDPALRCRNDQSKIPHTYREDEPCVFRPGVDWSDEKILASTVIPWLAMWLMYYEFWHATGEWLGGGEHPEVPTDSNATGNQSDEEELS